MDSRHCSKYARVRLVEAINNFGGSAAGGIGGEAGNILLGRFEGTRKEISRT